MIISILNFILSLLLFLVNFSLFCELKTFKKCRSKEENLFLVKAFFSSICFFYYIVLTVLIFIDICENNRNNIFFQIQEYIFNVYIIIVYLINLFISLEMFFTYQNPIYYYLIIFNIKTRKIYELILFVFIIAVASYNYFDPFNDKIYIYEKINDLSTPFILLDKWKWIILFAINIITLIYNFRLSLFISEFYFSKKDKLKKIINKKIISNIFYLLYSIYNILTFEYFIDLFNIFLNNYRLITLIGSFIFLAILIIDITIELSIISTTKFALYKLRNTFIGLFSDIFPNDFGDLLNDSNIEESIRILDFDYDNTNDYEYSKDETEISLVPKNFEDNELIYIFKNNIYLEDYFLSFFDQYLNILMASLFKMYNSKLFSTKSVNNQKLKEEINISCSCIGNNNISATYDIYDVKDIKENSSNFCFDRKSEKDPFVLFNDILGQNNGNINVKISTYFTNQCVFNIMNYNLFSKKIGSSLVSHCMVNAKKENKECQNKYWSLTAANAKEEYFKSIKNISFKSYDKNFNLDFFETNDEEISQYNKSNKDIANMIIQYFKYIQNGKGQTGSFLPILIGIFKVKINNFKTMLIFVSRNSLVQNIPKSFYTYWQLLRFDRKKPIKIASSKYARKAVVKDEPLFERLFSIEINKDNPNLNKIVLKNFSDFKEVLSNDIKFLKDNHLSYVNLLMMYYEYENTKNHEKEGAIKIKKTASDKAVIIQVDMPPKIISDDEDEDNIQIVKNINKNPLTKSKNDNQIFNSVNSSNEEDIFDDEYFDFMPDSGKLFNNLIDYSEKVNISAYEGNFYDFNCMCFFTFENVFNIRSKFNVTTQPYTIFEKKIIEYFGEFNLK